MTKTRHAVILFLCGHLAQSQRVPGFPTTSAGVAATPVFQVDDTQEVVNARHEVITGQLVIGAFADLQLTGDFGLIMAEVIYDICPNVMMLSRLAVDPASIPEPQKIFVLSFYILPPLYMAKLCTEQVRLVSWGPTQPPFGNVPPPPIRALLDSAFYYHEPTRLLDTSQWYMGMNASCERMATVRPISFASAAGITQEASTLAPALPSTDVATTTPYPGCEVITVGGAGGAAGQAFEYSNAGSSCTFASNACICSAIPLCIWAAHTSGGMRCTSGSGGVSCNDCPTKAGCTPSRQAICDAQKTACGCALSSGQCQWDAGAKRCFAPGGDMAFVSVPCSACSRQSICAPTSVQSVSPDEYTMMGVQEGGAGWLVNITFDREVLLGDGATGMISLSCVSMTNPSGPRTLIPINADRIILRGLQVSINTSLVPNDSPRDCSVVISDTALVDRDYTAFPGWDVGRYVISLSDLISPVLVGFSPANSASSVPVDVEVTFTFSERIAMGRVPEDAYLIVTVLGARPSLEELASGIENETLLSMVGAGVIIDNAVDIDVAAVSLSSSRVRFSGMGMIVSLSGIIQHSSHYSISLLERSVIDRAGNEFAGLTKGFFVFSTEPEVQAATEGGVPMTIVRVAGTALGVVFVVFALTCVFVGRIWRRRRKLLAKREAEERLADEAATVHRAKMDPTELGYDDPGMQILGRDLTNMQLEDELNRTATSANGLHLISPGATSPAEQTRGMGLSPLIFDNALYPEDIAASTLGKTQVRMPGSPKVAWGSSESHRSWEEDMAARAQAINTWNATTSQFPNGRLGEQQASKSYPDPSAQRRPYPAAAMPAAGAGYAGSPDAVLSPGAAMISAQMWSGNSQSGPSKGGGKIISKSGGASPGGTLKSSKISNSPAGTLKSTSKISPRGAGDTPVFFGKLEKKSDPLNSSLRSAARGRASPRTGQRTLSPQRLAGDLQRIANATSSPLAAGPPEPGTIASPHSIN